jgi:hypothetical protein
MAAPTDKIAKNTLVHWYNWYKNSNWYNRRFHSVVHALLDTVSILSL